MKPESLGYAGCIQVLKHIQTKKYRDPTNDLKTKSDLVLRLELIETRLLEMVSGFIRWRNKRQRYNRTSLNQPLWRS